MNDLDFGGDLRTALHRDAGLVGEPSPDLLDQLVRRRSHQRRQRLVLSGAVAAVVLIAAGIPIGVSLAASSAPSPASQPVAPAPSVSQDVAPITPSNSATPPGTPAVPSPAATTSGATPPTNAATPPTADSAALVLGPNGLGSLKLGMTRSEAESTRLVDPFRDEPSSDRCLWRSELSGAPAGSGMVLYSEDLGIATIDAYEGVRTPEGITIGSSLTAVAQAYPGWQGNDSIGRGYAPVPGNSQLVYRIGYAHGKVTQLTLQFVHQDCYE